MASLSAADARCADAITIEMPTNVHHAPLPRLPPRPLRLSERALAADPDRGAARRRLRAVRRSPRLHRGAARRLPRLLLRAQDRRLRDEIFDEIEKLANKSRGAGA